MVEAFQEARCMALDGCLPAVSTRYDSDAVRLLVGVCAVLGGLRSSHVFFLSSHKAAEYVADKTPTQILRYLEMLCADEILTLVEKGNQKKANRYKWNGNKTVDQ